MVSPSTPGTASNQLIATGGVPARTRPLCPYPEVARWNGSGDEKVADNFMCVPPVEIRIEPRALNLRSKGVFTVFITVPEGYDVRDWRIRSLECEGAHAVKGMVSRDGGTYIAKFDRRELKRVPPGRTVTLTVKGTFPKDGKEALPIGYGEVGVLR